MKPIGRIWPEALSKVVERKCILGTEMLAGLGCAEQREWEEPWEGEGHTRQKARSPQGTEAMGSGASTQEHTVILSHHLQHRQQQEQPALYELIVRSCLRACD